MREYYYSDGQDKKGPFSINDLKLENLSKDTLIWYEGLKDWVPAEKIEELVEILKVTPPPLNKPDETSKYSDHTAQNKSDLLTFCKENIPSKYKVSKKFFGDGIVIKNGVFSINVFKNKEGQISLIPKRQFTGWYMFGFLISFMILSILGAGIYYLIFKGSDQEMAEFHREISVNLGILKA